MGRKLRILRATMIAIASVGLLAASGCKTKRTATATAESEYQAHRIATSTLSDSLAIRLDIELDSMEIFIAAPTTPDPGHSDGMAKATTAKAYGVRATLRSQSRTEAAATTVETEHEAVDESSAETAQTICEPIGRSAIIFALIIFSALLIFIHIKRNNQ